MSTPALISALELAALLRRGAAGMPLLLDVRWSLGDGPGYDDYLAGHLPGAVFVDLDSVIAGSPGEHGRGGRHPMPHPDTFEAAIAACGVDDARPVIVYDAVGGYAAARCWWLLRHFGKADVAVLDGGLPAWLAHRLPVETGRRALDEGDFSLRRGAGRTIDAAGAALYAAEGVLVDARPRERYLGERDDLDAVAGHIPGAVNVPPATLIASDGMMLAPVELRRRFAAAGVTGERPIAVYCGSGINAMRAALALAVAELDEEAAVYVGSWSDWISDPDRPVEVGDPRLVTAS